MGSLDDYIQQEAALGDFESSGAFRVDLQEAKRKLASFGQVDDELWTLQWGMAFLELGCRYLSITTNRREWVLELTEAPTLPDALLAELSAARLSFRSGGGPVQRIVLGLCGISGWDLEAVCWSQGGRATWLMGEGEAESIESFPTLKVRFEGTAPKFPYYLWSERFFFSPMQINIYNGVINRSGAHPIVGSSWGPLKYWIEWHAKGEATPGFRDRPLGQSRAVYFQGEVTSPYGGVGPIAFQYWDEEPLEHECVVLVRPEFKGTSLFRPVQSGCLLEPFEVTDFPHGFEVIYDCGEAETDLSGLSLKTADGGYSELLARRVALDKVVGLVCDSLVEAEILMRPEKMPWWADLLPGAWGGFATLVAFLAWPIGTLPCLLYGSPAYFYFWYSRRLRRKAFEKRRVVKSQELSKVSSELESFWQNHPPVEH
ncbi:MAG TPA: hypothetical protein EYO33_20935 [Phycisphaerales bacterium]|nr:hypothetical protein [Phycisphaerales bacterium]